MNNFGSVFHLAYFGNQFWEYYLQFCEVASIVEEPLCKHV